VNRLRKKFHGRRLTPLTMGLILLAIGALFLVGIIYKPQLQSALSPGTTITAEFQDNYRDRLVPQKSTVKLAGLEIGKVTGVEESDHGTALISMMIAADLDKLGPAPSAAIAPLTILGGGFSVELYPGGGPGAYDPDNVIPVSRTREPVELDPILDSLPRPVRGSLQGTVGSLKDTLAQGGSDSLRRVVSDAPSVLGPTGDVLRAAQGTRPEQDLPQLVTNLETTAEVIGDRSEQVGQIVDDAHTTTTVLARQSQALGDTVSKLPTTLQDTRDGLDHLGGTLDRLTDTAKAFRPAAQDVEPLLDELTPVLHQADPLLRNLRPVLDDAGPAVKELVPTAGQANSILEDVRGPVIDRVNGPVMSTVLNTYRGTGPFQGTGGGVQADHTFYQELGYMVTGLGRASQTQDAQGATLNFQVGAGAGAVNAGGLSLEQAVRMLTLPGAPAGQGPGAPATGNPLSPGGLTGPLTGQQQQQTQASPGAAQDNPPAYGPPLGPGTTIGKQGVGR
jgi:phospholipid/cholesterol/gamma-HCH transport system substrate-binding protein